MKKKKKYQQSSVMLIQERYKDTNALVKTVMNPWHISFYYDLLFILLWLDEVAEEQVNTCPRLLASDWHEVLQDIIH